MHSQGLTAVCLSFPGRYRMKPKGGGLRLKVVQLDGWMQLLTDAGLFNTSFTPLDATLAFVWSRLVVQKEWTRNPTNLRASF